MTAAAAPLTLEQGSPVLLRYRGHMLCTYGLLMGAAYALMGLVVIAILHSTGGSALDAAAACLQLTLAGILGARLLSVVFEDGLTKLMTKPAQALLRPGYWLHGGMIGVACSIAARYSSNPAALISFLDALGLALPLFEVLSRLGCHSYGCCFGAPVAQSSTHKHSKACTGCHGHAPLLTVRYHDASSACVRLCPQLKGVALFPAQLLSAALFLAQYAASLLLLRLLAAAGVASVPAGAPLAASLVAHSAVRLFTEQYRADFRGSALGGLLSMTGFISVALAAVGLAVQRYAAALSLAYPTAALISGLSPASGALAQALYVGGPTAALCMAGTAASSALAYGYHRGSVGRWL